jgi:hypothetical protein
MRENVIIYKRLNLTIFSYAEFESHVSFHVGITNILKAFHLNF